MLVCLALVTLVVSVEEIADTNNNLLHVEIKCSPWLDLTGLTRRHMCRMIKSVSSTLFLLRLNDLININFSLVLC